MVNTNTILKLIQYIIYSVEFFLAGEAIFHNRVKEWIKYIVVIMIYLSIIVPSMLITGSVNFFVKLALNIWIYILLFQGTLSSRLVHFLGVYIFTGMVEGVVSGIGTLILYKPFNNLGVSMVSYGIQLIVAIISAVLTLVITTRAWAKKVVSYFQTLRWFQNVIIIIMVLSGTLVLVISEVLLEYIENKEVGFILHTANLVLVITILIGIIWIVSSVYGKEYYLKQNHLKEEIIFTQQKYYQNIYENDREMRKFRHDIYSQLGCMRLLMAEGKTEQAIQYLDTIDNSFSKIAVNKYHTGSEILDVILNQKCLEANQKEIDIKVEGKLERADSIDAYDLCMIFANALNNGMEACEILSDREKVIKVSLLEHGNTTYFQFVNPATTKMYEMARQNKTAKGDRENHGFGIENIRMAVEKYGGKMEYRYKDEKLTLEIYFEV